MSPSVRGLFVVLINFFNLQDILTFNVDTSVPIVKIGNSGSYFGFSVAQHQRLIDYDNDIYEHVIIVGAPQDNITEGSPKLTSINRPGAVFYCPITSREQDCQPIRIHRDDPYRGEDRNNQWMGVSVASQGKKEGTAVACAHRHKNVGPGHRWGQGLCISMTNELDEDRFYEPCAGKSTDKGHNEYGFCQAGYSVDVSKDGDLLVGVPGPYNWRGAVFKNIIEFPDLTVFAKWYSSRVEDPPEDNPENIPEPPLAYYSFLGASTKISEIFGRKTYISGAPRSRDIGQVLLFTNNEDDDYLDVERSNILDGEQFGGQFGFDVAVVDFNHDGLEDLVVSAPFYFEQNVGGMVYVYMNENNQISKDRVVKIPSPERKRDACLALMCEQGRFGFSLAALGDVDLDGYDDLAVGAPFEGNGAVYIFRGSKDGIIPKYSQRIYADDLLSVQPLTTWGYSLIGGNDVDDNGYPDLVVGAYESSKALVMRTRPVVTIESQLTFSPSKINPQVTVCRQDNRQNNCWDVQICMKFKAKPYEKFTQELNVEYVLEAEKYRGREIPRVLIKGADANENYRIGRTTVLERQRLDSFKCRTHLVYLQKNNRDFLHPIWFKLSYKLEDQITPEMYPGDDLPDLNDFPVLDGQQSFIESAIEFAKNCGVDDKCDSDLSVDARFGGLEQLDNGDYVYKKESDVINRELILEIHVENKDQAEDAHETTLMLTLPEDVGYIGSSALAGGYGCTLLKDVVTCDLGNPMGPGDKAVLTVRLNAADVSSNKKKVEFVLEVNTTSTDIYEEDNSKILRVRVMTETDLAVSGKSDPTQVFYSGEIRGESAIDFEDQIGPEVVHEYTVENAGSSRVRGASVVIFWPYEVENNYTQGKHLLYMTQPPSSNSPNVQCTYDSRYINPTNVILDRESLNEIWSNRRNVRPTYETNPPLNNNDTRVILDIKDLSKEVNSRRKRATVIRAEQVIEGGKTLDVVTMDCDRKTAKCFKIECELGVMDERAAYTIKLRSRLWNSTFLEDYRNVDRVEIFSKAMIKIPESLNIKQTTNVNDVYYIKTTAIPDVEVASGEGIPLWVIILAVIGGLIVLIIIIVLLFKCGFFRRDRAEEMRQHKGKVEKQKYDEDMYN